MIKKINFKEAKKLYKIDIIRDFPSNERMPFSKYKRCIKNKLINAYIYYLENNKCGYIITTEDEEAVFINYLGIIPSKRKQGYGSEMISELKELLNKKKYIIIEADSEVIAKNYSELEIIKKRKNFYFKNGFEEIKNIYYNIFGVTYNLLVYRINCKNVTNVEAIEITKKFYMKLGFKMHMFNAKVE